MSQPIQATGLAAELGAEIPVIAAPMAGGPSTPALVTAAASVGGIGFLAGGYKTAEQLAEQIQQVRTSTDRFGVNLFTPNHVPVDASAYSAYRQALQPWADQYGVTLPETPREDDDAWHQKLALLTQSPVPVVTFTFGLPTREEITTLQLAGSRVLQTVTTLREAQQAADSGVDGLIVQSSQAGGHSGTWTPEQPLAQTRTADLVGRIGTEVSPPVWAAGGVATPAGVREALAAGAEAAVLGTVLLRSDESGASIVYQGALAASSGVSGQPETVLTRAFSGRPARALRNEFSSAFSDAAPLGFPALHYLTSPLRKAATAAEDARALNLWAGTGYREATAEPAARILWRLAGG